MYALGIDLGTTYTAAATWRNGKTEIVSLGSRASTVPSVVVPREDGTTLTGEAASRRALAEPQLVAREFKRRLGDPTPILLGGAPYSAVALTGRLLRWVVGEVTSREGGPPAAVCVSHPANWGPYKVDLLRQVPQIAGLTMPVRYTTEPEAAATFYAQQERVPAGAMVAVYDLGGGTFDAAVLRKTRTGFEIIGQPGGIERLGGIDFDAAVFAHVARALDGRLEELDEDDPTTIAAVARLREECTVAKEVLSADTDTAITVLLPGIATEVRLTRGELEAMVRPALYDSIEVLKSVLRSAEVSPEQLHSVLLVGGSSQMPVVAQLVGAELGRPVAVDAHPKHAVALGAATLAGGAAIPAQAAAAGASPIAPAQPPAPVAPSGAASTAQSTAELPGAGPPARATAAEQPTAVLRGVAAVPPQQAAPRQATAPSQQAAPTQAAEPPRQTRPSQATTPPPQATTLPPPATTPLAPLPLSPPRPSPPPRRRIGMLAIGVAAVAVLAAAGGAYAILRPDPDGGSGSGSPTGAPTTAPATTPPNPPFEGTLSGHTRDVWTVAFSPDGQLLASASVDMTIRLWDTITGEPRGEPITGHTNEVASAVFNPAGTLLASAADDRTIRLWDAATGEPQGEPLTGHTDEVTIAVFSPDGTTIASAGDDATVRLWDAASGEQLSVPVQGTPVRTVAYSSDGATLAIGGFDGQIWLLDTVTGELGEPLTGHQDTVRGLEFSPDGTVLASASDDRTVRLWDVAGRQPRGEPLTGHTDEVWAVAFSPDATLLASGGIDRTVRLWDAATGLPLTEPLTGHTGGIRDVAVSPDGRSVASGGSDRTIRLWNITQVG